MDDIKFMDEKMDQRNMGKLWTKMDGNCIVFWLGMTFLGSLSRTTKAENWPLQCFNRAISMASTATFSCGNRGVGDVGDGLSNV